MSVSFKYIYGPVESWRMGKSLGIDPLSDIAKICNLDCVYCQLGRTRYLTNERREYVPTQAILDELNSFFAHAKQNNPALIEKIDYITFSGRGEPTLALNLGEMIREIRRTYQESIAVITNSTLLHLPEVREDLQASDLVIAKLDACDEVSFAEVDVGMEGIHFDKVIEGISTFRKSYRGKLALRVMFIQENQANAKAIAELLKNIPVDEIQINTPLRPSAVKPLAPPVIEEIKSHFAGMPAVALYDCECKETQPYNERDTILRHGGYKKINRS